MNFHSSVEWAVVGTNHLSLSSQAQRSPSPLDSGVKPQQPARRCHGMNLWKVILMINLLHCVHHKYTGKYQWLRVGNCKELFSLGDTCQQAWFNSSTGFALDRLQHILNISQMPLLDICRGHCLWRIFLSCGEILDVETF